MRFIYLILICFAAPVAAAIAWLRGLRAPSRRERLADRFGRPVLTPRLPTIWVHAASMGEAQAGAALVRCLLSQYPQYEIVMTTMTTTGAERVRTLFSERVLHCYLPYDLPFAVRGFLDRIRPTIGVILETELWPNLLSACRNRGIPVAIVSARISPRTADRYRRFAGLFHGALRDTQIAAQTDVDAERFRVLGARHVQTGGNIKFDLDIPDTIVQAGAAFRAAAGDRFIWVAGSTHPGEEAAAVFAHRELLRQHPHALLILAPRRPERFEEVRALLVAEGLPFISQSQGDSISKDTAVLFVDTMGELLKCYAAADLAFVGGSLVDVGGHSLLEPAALGVATLCGPYISSTQDAFQRLAEASGVVQVASRERLAAEVRRLAGDAEARRTLGARARQVVLENRGALQRILNIVAAALHR